MNLLRRLECIETLDGVELFWEPREDILLRDVTVYMADTSRELKVASPLITTGRFFIGCGNYGVTTTFKVRATTSTGDIEDSEPIEPIWIDNKARLLLKEIRRRELTWMRAHPFGAYKFNILMRNQYGTPCPRCGDKYCENGPNHNCPVCLGTGLEKPYYVYPLKELMVSQEPKDDKVTGDEGIKRLDVIRNFRTVFNGMIREDDLISTKNETYSVQLQTVMASVGNTPVAYMLQCSQLLPKDPRYPVIKNLIAGE